MAATAAAAGASAAAAAAAAPRVAVVTGANVGLGRLAAERLACGGFEVVLACRDSGRGEEAAAAVRERAQTNGVTAGGDARFMQCDLASLRGIAEFCDTFKSEYGARGVSVLMNNAGVMAPPTRRVTEDGFELQFGTNHLGHFALTGGLLEAMAPDCRVVTVASSAHEFGVMNFDDLQSAAWPFGYGGLGWTAYGQSKLANVLFSNELARKLADAGSGVTSNACHPGVVDTALPRNLPIPAYDLLFKPAGVLIDVESGVRGQMFLATSDEAEGVSGRYMSEQALKGRPGVHEWAEPSAAARNNAHAARLWAESERLTRVTYDFGRVGALVEDLAAVAA